MTLQGLRPLYFCAVFVFFTPALLSQFETNTPALLCQFGTLPPALLCKPCTRYSLHFCTKLVRRHGVRTTGTPVSGEAGRRRSESAQRRQRPTEPRSSVLASVERDRRPSVLNRQLANRGGPFGVPICWLYDTPVFHPWVWGWEAHGAPSP